MTGHELPLRHLESGGTVVTATRRQARVLRRVHDTAQRRAGRQVWRSADVLPLDAWLERCWGEIALSGDAPQLLTPAEAAWPWRREVRPQADATLLEERDLAAAGRSAWAALVTHCGRVDDLERLPLTRDQQAFRDWARSVEARLTHEGWLDPALLPAALAARAERLAPAMRVLFAGFDRPTALLESLVRALAAAGGDARFAPCPAVSGRAVAHAAEHPQAELEAILDWLAARLEAEPAALLGVVMPGIGSRRGSFERAFESALQPTLELPGGLERDRRFDLPGGPPLSSLGIVGDALACLEATGGTLEFDQASRLLRSPCLGAGEEAGARLRLDVALRRAGSFVLPVQVLARQARDAGCASVASALTATAALAAGPASRPPSDWAGAFGALLKAWGWPAPRALASDEFQAAERFREALAHLARMDRVAPVLTAAAARLELAELCAAPFQPERGDAQVLVLDGFEAPGLPLDGLWVGALTAAGWPRAPSPDPFLPLALQRRLELPGATAEACRDEALGITEAWCGTAPEVVFSWPERQDDAEAEPSRLLPAGLEPHARRPRPAGRAQLLLAAGGGEELREDPVPALDPARARGGARIVELQAQCPFRAFAQLRLGARELEEPGPGIDRRVRGNVLHAALEQAWRQLGGSEALHALDADERTALIRRSVAAAIGRELAIPVAPRLRALEVAWQEAAVAAMLDLDASRPPFEVTGLEAPLERQFAGVPLRLRVDRIDRTAAGLVVIDYKTGDPRVAQWRGARPDAPQLPLYAVLAGDEVAAVAFAAVRASGARYRAVGDAEAGLPGQVAAERFELTEDGEKGLAWPQLKSRWAAWLAALLEQYRAGDATVDPKQPQTCRLCHLGTLCRVDRRDAGEERKGGGANE